MGEVLICVERIRKNDKVIAYKLVDEDGETKEYTRDEVYDILFNKKAYITNLRLTQNGRIIPLKYDVKPKGNKKAKMSEEDADRL